GFELSVHIGETVIGYEKKSGLIEDPGLASGFDYAANVRVHTFRAFDRGGRTRAVLVMYIVERQQMNKHQVRLVRVDYVFTDRGSASVGRVVTPRSVLQGFRQQTWRRVLSSAFPGLSCTRWIGDLRDAVVNVGANRHRPTHVSGNQSRFFCHAPERFRLQRFGKPVPLARLRIGGRFEDSILNDSMN